MQFFGIEDVKDLTKASQTTIEWASGSNLRIGGQAYSVTSVLTLDTATDIDTGAIASDTIYYIYAVVVAGTVSLKYSLSNSVPAGYSAYRLIGNFATDEISEIYETNIIAQPVAYARYNTSSANFAITGTNTVPLNAIDGDIAACSLSLSGDDFILQPGKYDIEWYGYIAINSSDKIATTALYNVTDFVELRRGTLVYGNVSGEIYTTSHGSHQITITKPTTFRYQAILVQGSTGSINFGASFAAPNSEKAVVKITKMK